MWMAYCVQALTCLAETPEGRRKLQDYVDKVRSMIVAQANSASYPQRDVTGSE